MIVLHHNDADGRCAAAIAYRWVQRCNPKLQTLFISLDYKDPVPVNAIMDGEMVVILDFSLKPDVMAEVLKKTRDVAWCDHHKTAESYDYGRLLAGIRDFSDKGLSGCELAWKYFFPHDEIPRAVTYLGDYDAWRLQYATLTFEFYEGLKLEDQSPKSKFWRMLFNAEGMDSVHAVAAQGRLAIKYRDNYCSGISEAFGYVTEIAGHRAFAMNLYQFGSKAFGDNFEKYPICIAYIHDGRTFTVSLYSKTVDVGEICKSLGGGGHSGAAGFICTTLPFSPTEKE
jgi:oligoribonuclease NrnB/cAMP/cGMP phosphodiesterase (DHH superfamily)